MKLAPLTLMTLAASLAMLTLYHLPGHADYMARISQTQQQEQ